METKPGKVSIKTQVSSEIDSESDIPLEKIVEKKKKRETQRSEAIMHFHYYAAILCDKPLSLKQNDAPVQEKGKNHVSRDREMHRRDFPISPATAHKEEPVAINSEILQATGQSSSVPLFEFRGSSLSDITDPVAVFDTSSAVDVQPLVESASTVGPAHNNRGQYSAFLPPANTPHSQRNEPMRTPFSTITQRERLNALRLGDSNDEHTMRISYPFQRWFGEHSVHVSLRRDSLSESAMVLQPSDVRAYDALARQLDYWPKQIPHILLPDSSGDERQQGQQREQEEEQ